MIVTPREGIGPFRLGMTPEEARAAVTLTPRAVMRGAQLTLQYVELGLNAEFDTDGRLFSLGGWKQVGASLRLFGLDPLRREVTAVLAELSKHATIGLPQDGFSFRYPGLGVMLHRAYCPRDAADSAIEGRRFDALRLASDLI